MLAGVHNGNCPTRIMLSALEGKWKMLLVYHLLYGDMRAGELERAVPEASRQVLHAHLRELELDGLVARRVFAESPPRVEYYLTPLGRSLEPVLDSMYAWGRRHGADIQRLRGQPEAVNALEVPS